MTTISDGRIGFYEAFAIIGAIGIMVGGIVLAVGWVLKSIRRGSLWNHDGSTL